MQDTATPTTGTDAPFGLSALSVRPRKSPQAVQVLAIADATGSSGPFARGIEQILHALAERLPQQIAKVDFGLVASRDVDIGERDEALLSGGDGTALQHAVARLRFEGGGDADETHFASVRDALSYPWDEGPMRRRAIVLLGSSDSKPIAGMTLEQLALELMRRRIAVFIVAPSATNLRRLAELTDGLFFELSNAPAAQEVQRLVQRLTASMTQTLCRAGVSAGSGGRSGGVGIGGHGQLIIRVTDRERDRAYERPTQTQRYLYSHCDSGERMWRIGTRYKLSEPEYKIFAVEIVGDVVLGLRARDDIPQLIRVLLRRDETVVHNMTRDILDFLAPLYDPGFKPPPRDDE